MKRIMMVVCTVLLTTGPSFAAENAAQDLGRGLIVGGVGAGAPGISAVGVVVDILGGVFGGKKIDTESPEFRARIKKQWDAGVKFEVLRRNRKMLAPTPNTTPEQIKAQAESYCADIDKTVAGQGYLLIPRREAESNFVLKGILPEGDEDIKYKLSKNPVDNCVAELIKAGERMVALEKKKAAE